MGEQALKSIVIKPLQSISNHGLMSLPTELKYPMITENSLRNIYATTFAAAYADKVFPDVTASNVMAHADAYGTAYNVAYDNMESKEFTFNGVDAKAVAHAKCHAHVTIFTYAYHFSYNLH